jgi:hypothetical protein
LVEQAALAPQQLLLNERMQQQQQPISAPMPPVLRRDWVASAQDDSSVR